MLVSLFYKKNTVISSLITEREELIAEFDKAKNEYVQIVKQNYYKKHCQNRSDNNLG